MKDSVFDISHDVDSFSTASCHTFGASCASMAVRRGKRKNNDRLTIPEYFDDKVVFITGATGFMGKVLMEKLLRSCPGINKIYILMRPKKGKGIHERLQQLFELPMFVKVKRLDPELFKKVVPLEGDVTEIRLGLSDQDMQKLKDEVSVVFHVAACVRFDDSLKNAAFLNLRGTVEAMKIALEMKKLDCFLHMSTAYCVKHRETIEEKIYTPPAEWRQVLRLAEENDDDTLHMLTPKLMGEYPNTYTFTKALAEDAVREFSDRIPAIILRPSIVISSYVEPLPGWVDNFNGPVALIVASGKGIVRTIYSDPNVRSDFIPVDLAVRAMIVCVWNRATSLNVSENLEVYNCAAGGIKAITQNELVDIGHHVTQEVPLNDVLWLPGGKVTKCKFEYYTNVILFHFFPAILVDSLLQLFNKPPMLARIQRKIFVANTALEYFVTRQWNFINKKIILLDGEILEEDRNDFSYYKPEIDLVEYFRAAAFGGRQYLMKEDNTDLDPAKKHYRRMYWVDKGVKTVFLLTCGYLSVKFNIIQSINYNFVSPVLEFILSFF